MHKKRSLLISVGLIALVGMVAVVSFCGEQENAIGAVPLEGSGQFDLATELENAVSGDRITLEDDAVLLRDAPIKQGVILDDGGFMLRISADTILTIEGTLISSGDLRVDFNGSVAVTNGGLVSIDNDDKETTVAGYLEVYKGGTVNIGLTKNSTFNCLGSGRLFIDGLMVVGSKTSVSLVEVRNATVTGEVRISEGSTFLIYDVLTLGSAPTHTAEMTNSALITGKFSLNSMAYIVVYGESNFNKPVGTIKDPNIKDPSVNTVFKMLSKAYATVYASSGSKRVLVFPPTSNLRDYQLTDWRDMHGDIVTADMNIQVGSAGNTEISGDVIKNTYRIVFTQDKSIRWVVNGIDKGSYWEEPGVYGASYTISIRQAPGNTDLPSIFKDGIPYMAGTSFVVDGDTIFTTSNSYPGPGDSLVPVLSALVVILLAVLVILVIMLRKKNMQAEG
ncbi:MAG: hypothetical protein FWG60_01330 [Methanomassiliicoccaceae archaeon]|nr:hypothetical protein [Methanomassiliicoccaceae archaeon]